MQAQTAPNASSARGRIERVCVIVNPRAGGVRRRHSTVGELQTLVRGRGEVVVTRDDEELQRTIANARAAAVDTIGICGGDGTNLHTLTAIDKAYGHAPWPRIALLAGGTLNTAASNLGASGSPMRRLDTLLRSHEPRVRTLPLVRVNGRVGFIFGAQMVARTLDAYYAGSASPLGAAWLAARIVGSAAVDGPFARGLLAPEDVDITIDDAPTRHLRATALLASTVPCPVAGLRVMPRAGEDGCFQLIATTTSPARIFRELDRIIAGLPVRQFAVDELARKAVLDLGEGARFTVDGDLFSERHVTLEATEPVELVYAA